MHSDILPNTSKESIFLQREEGFNAVGSVALDGMFGKESSTKEKQILFPKSIAVEAIKSFIGELQ